MLKDSHYVRKIKGGIVYTLCGESFPEKGSFRLFVWGVCPACVQVKKQEKRAR